MRVPGDFQHFSPGHCLQTEMREAVFKAAVAPAQQRFGQDHGADVMEHGQASAIGKLPTDQT